MVDGEVCAAVCFHWEHGGVLCCTSAFLHVLQHLTCKSLRRALALLRRQQQQQRDFTRKLLHLTLALLHLTLIRQPLSIIYLTSTLIQPTLNSFPHYRLIYLPLSPLQP